MEKKHKVGIFSRSDRKDYAWLTSILTSQDCSDWVQDVRSTVISNTLTTFIDDASQCTFGILYHTKNRGGVNISDITGALYDEEMKILHELLGKGNFIVVIDDLKDSSFEEKRRILNIQPSIETLACDLLLVSNTEKTNTTTLVAKLKNLRPFHSTPAPEVQKSHDGLFCSNNIKDNIKIKTPNVKNKNPECSSRCESPKTQNNTSEVQMNVCAPVMSSRSKNNKEPIYMNLLSLFDGSERLASFDNPNCRGNIENLQNSSSNENLSTWGRSGSCETVNGNEGPELCSGLETLDKGKFYVDPKVPCLDELFKEMLGKIHIKQNSETQPSYNNSERASKSEKPPTWCNHENSQSTCNNNKSPEKHSNTPKPKIGFYDENARKWRRNENLETLSSDNNPKKPSTSTPGSYVPQPSKGNLRTQTETLTKNKNPERIPNNENMKWYFNESSHTWYRN
ncbi:uncharacterized protein LOC143923387 [Lithobates pipiens]